MNDFIEFILNNVTNAPPFIKVDQDGRYSLAGRSDLANNLEVDYGQFGKHKLMTLNHTATLNTFINFFMLMDEVDEKMGLEDDDVLEFLRGQFGFVLDAFFMNVNHEEQRFDYSLATMFLFCKSNPQLCNEARYYFTADKDTLEAGEKLNQNKIPQDEQIKGQQFNDPYVSMAYEIALKQNKQPSEVMMNWSTSELVVVFAKMQNDAWQDYYRQAKAAESKKKPKIVRRQPFFFEEIVNQGDENG